jgi:hypothetical protein
MTFNEYGYLQGEIPAECVADCSHQGACDDDVAFWVRKLGFEEAIAAARPQAVSYLRDFGAWDDLDTASNETLAQRILWTACCDVRESGEPWIGLVH